MRAVPVLRSSSEPCPSGRRCNSRKVVWVLSPPWVQIPPVPPEGSSRISAITFASLKPKKRKPPDLRWLSLFHPCLAISPVRPHRSSAVPLSEFDFRAHEIAPSSPFTQSSHPATDLRLQRRLRLLQRRALRRRLLAGAGLRLAVGANVVAETQGVAATWSLQLRCRATRFTEEPSDLPDVR
jgi:hypothetical protein